MIENFERKRPYVPRPNKSICYNLDWKTLTDEQQVLYKEALKQTRSSWQRNIVVQMFSPNGCETPLKEFAAMKNETKQRKVLLSLIERLHTIPGVTVYMQKAQYPIDNSWRINVPYDEPRPPRPELPPGAPIPGHTPSKIRTILLSLQNRPARYAPTIIHKFINDGFVSTRVITAVAIRHHDKKEMSALRYIIKRMNAKKIHVERVERPPYIHYEVLSGTFARDYKGPRYCLPVSDVTEKISGLTFPPAEKPKPTDKSIRKFAKDAWDKL